MGFAKFSLGSDKLVGSWKLEFWLLMVILLVSLIVHSCLIVEYFTEFSEVAVFWKNGFWPFSGFCAQNGIEKKSGNWLEKLFGKNRIFCIFVFLGFLWGHFGLGKFSGKNSGKNGKVRKFNSKLLFSGKMAPEFIIEIGWNLVVWLSPVFTGFYMALKMCMHTGWSWLAWV